MGYVVWLWAVAAVFTLLLFRPLFLLCLNRGALFLMFSKSLVCLAYTMVRLAQILLANEEWAGICLKVTNQLSLCIKWHVTLLALNRLHAVFWPMTYSRWWLRKKTYIRIWLLLCPLSCAVYFCLIYFTSGPIFGALLSMIPMIIGAILPAIFYTLLLARIIKEKDRSTTTTQQQQNRREVVEVDRVRMCIVFFSSLLPHLLSALNSAANYLFPHYNDDPVLNVAVNVIFVLSNTCVEEIVLILLCRDFRVLIRQQAIDFVAYWTCQGRHNNNMVGPIETISVLNRSGQVTNWSSSRRMAAAANNQSSNWAPQSR